jgi:hypothetical protein
MVGNDAGVKPQIRPRRCSIFSVRNRTLRRTALCKSIVDIELALIQLQYALADYYNRGQSDCDADHNALDAPFRELRNGARSTQIAIDLFCHSATSSGETPARPPIWPRKNTQD